MPSQDYHEDESLRVENERHAGIVVKDSKVLLLHRFKNGLEYYVFPGGHRRISEKGEEVVIREIEEETAIVVSNPKLVINVKGDYDGKQEDFYYLCDWVSGDEPRLNGEEVVRNCRENYFEPKWIDVSEIRNLDIKPLFAKKWLLENLSKVQT
ncbi:MAG: NUDIX domain-containing protein [Patescibacteria group bacterium]|jgi:8-oxo-dGTP diphosphatase